MLSWLIEMVFGVVVALFLSLQLWLRLRKGRRDKLLSQLKSEQSRAELQAVLQGGWRERYFKSVRGLEAWSMGRYGPRQGGMPSWRCFIRTAKDSLFYSLYAILLGWVWFDHVPIEEIEDFLGRTSDWQRGKFGFLTMLYFWISFKYLVSRGQEPSESIQPKLNAFLSDYAQRSGFLAKAARWALETGSWLVQFVAFAYWAILPFAYTIGAGVALFTAVMLVVAFVVLMGSGPIGAVIIVFFFLFLPLTNAVADAFSINISRGFWAKVTQDRPSASRIVKRMLTELGYGILCIFFLLALMRGALYFWENQRPPSARFDLVAYLADIRADWGSGFALGVMCFTVLIPVLIHITIGFAAFFTQRSRMQGRALSMLEAEAALGLDERGMNDVAHMLLRAEFRAWFRAFIVALVFLGVVLGVLGGLGWGLWQVL